MIYGHLIRGGEVRCALLKNRWNRPVSPNGSYFVDGLSQDIAEAKIFLQVLKTASIRATEEKTCQTQTSLKKPSAIDGRCSSVTENDKYKYGPPCETWTFKQLL